MLAGLVHGTFRGYASLVSLFNFMDVYFPMFAYVTYWLAGCSYVTHWHLTLLLPLPPPAPLAFTQRRMTPLPPVR